MKLNSNDLLQRNELRNVYGGYSYFNCTRTKTEDNGSMIITTTYTGGSILPGTVDSWKATWESLGWSTNCVGTDTLTPTPDYGGYGGHFV